jgi:FkbM family methyltransferase
MKGLFSKERPRPKTPKPLPMRVRRCIRKLIERVSGRLIIPPGDVYLLPELRHLTRFFEYFSVDCVFDVGANIGQYRELLRNEVGFTGPIISFEPIPELAEVLRAKTSSDPKWFVETTALDREPGPAIFHIMQDSQFSSLHSPDSDQPKILNAWNKVTREVSVDRSTLGIELPRWRDKLRFTRPFLKMDTQGNDLAVLEGAGEAVRAFVGLQSELSFQRIYNGSPGFAEALARYSEFGFQLSALVPNNVGHFPLLVELDCIMFRDDDVTHLERNQSD